MCSSTWYMVGWVLQTTICTTTTTTTTATVLWSSLHDITVHPSQPRFTPLLSTHPFTFEGQAAVGWRHARCVCEGTHAGCVATVLWCDGRVRPERPQSIRDPHAVARFVFRRCVCVRVGQRQASVLPPSVY